MSNDAYNNLTNRQRVYVDAIREHANDLGIDTTKTKGKIWIPNWITHDQSRRTGRGMFNIPEVPSPLSGETVDDPVTTDEMSAHNADAERIVDSILVGS